MLVFLFSLLSAFLPYTDECTVCYFPVPDSSDHSEDVDEQIELTCKCIKNHMSLLWKFKSFFVVAKNGLWTLLYLYIWFPWRESKPTVCLTICSSYLSFGQLEGSSACNTIHQMTGKSVIYCSCHLLSLDVWRGLGWNEPGRQKLGKHSSCYVESYIATHTRFQPFFGQELPLLGSSVQLVCMSECPL